MRLLAVAAAAFASVVAGAESALPPAAAAATTTIEGTVLQGRGWEPLRLDGLRVSLNGGERVTFTRADGRFALPGVGAGVYLLEVEAAPWAPSAAASGRLPATSTGALFSTYRVQVAPPKGAGADAASGGGVTVTGVQELRYPGAPRLPAAHPLEIAPAAPASFFEERPKPSVWGLLANPTVLMILFMGGMVFVMPRMMVRRISAWPSGAGRHEAAAHGAVGTICAGVC
jgi:hypothetical protein